jgi:hypothetical protein
MSNGGQTRVVPLTSLPGSGDGPRGRTSNKELGVESPPVCAWRFAEPSERVRPTRASVSSDRKTRRLGVAV